MSALRLLVDVLTEIGEGNAVSIIPIHAELTTSALGISADLAVHYALAGAMLAERLAIDEEALADVLLADLRR